MVMYKNLINDVLWMYMDVLEKIEKSKEIQADSINAQNIQTFFTLYF